MCRDVYNIYVCMYMHTHICMSANIFRRIYVYMYVKARNCQRLKTSLLIGPWDNMHLSKVHGAPEQSAWLVSYITYTYTCICAYICVCIYVHKYFKAYNTYVYVFIGIKFSPSPPPSPPHPRTKPTLTPTLKPTLTPTLTPTLDLAKTRAVTSRVHNVYITNCSLY